MRTKSGCRTQSREITPLNPANPASRAASDGETNLPFAAHVSPRDNFLKMSDEHAVSLRSPNPSGVHSGFFRLLARRMGATRARKLANTFETWRACGKGRIHGQNPHRRIRVSQIMASPRPRLGASRSTVRCGTVGNLA